PGAGSEDHCSLAGGRPADETLAEQGERQARPGDLRAAGEAADARQALGDGDGGADVDGEGGEDHVGPAGEGQEQAPLSLGRAARKETSCERPDRPTTEQSRRNGRAMLSSFKHKLAVYFLLLAVAPLTAAFWGFGTIAKHAEERQVDSRLGAELRAVFASYERQADHVKAVARSLAGHRDVQRGLRLGSFGRLPSDVTIAGSHRLVVGRR